MIKTWQERWNPPDHGEGVRSRDIAMQSEIDELRARVAELERIQAQALEALKAARFHKNWMSEDRLALVIAAITAIEQGEKG